MKLLSTPEQIDKILTMLMFGGNLKAVVSCSDEVAGRFKSIGYNVSKVEDKYVIWL